MMFSRAAPTVLFTAFCLAVAGTYVTGGGSDLTRPGQMSSSEIAAMDSYYAEMRLALQVGDEARFQELIEGQIAAMQAGEHPRLDDPDTLHAPYQMLREIAMEGSPEQLRDLLARYPGLNLNTPQGRYGAVPLIWATSNAAEMPEMLQTLIAAGADPRFSTSTGHTVLHAIGSPFHYYDDVDDPARAIDLLPPELVTQAKSSGETPLHLALANIAVDHAVALLERGADPNAPYPDGAARPDIAGQPPLMVAGSDPDVVEALLFAGADPTARDAQGRRIVDVVSAGVRAAEAELQERVNASAAEAYDREYVADHRRARDMIRAALDARLAQGN